MTPAERLAYLLEPVFVPTNRQVLFADVTAAVGLEAGALVVGTIKSASAANPLLETVLIAMSTVGLGLGTEERRAMIDQLALAGEWTNEVRDAVKALGGVNQVRWETEGYEVEPTLALVTKEAIVAATRSAISAKATAVHGWLDVVDLAAYTEAELQAYCDSLLASADGNPPGGE